MPPPLAPPKLNDHEITVTVHGLIQQLTLTSKLTELETPVAYLLLACLSLLVGHFVPHLLDLLTKYVYSYFAENRKVPKGKSYPNI